MTGPANGTGRLVGELGPRTRRLIYGPMTEADLEAEMPLMIRVDRAHVVMLAERGLIPPATAVALLDCMAELAGTGYRALRCRPAPRGLFLMYEGFLIERLGAGVGGTLQSGRSRNDLKATMTALALRGWTLEFAGQLIRLEAVLLSGARRHREVIMPVHTHFQAAMPVTYGHYLLGTAYALGREIDAVLTAATGLDTCPLGACAVAGTDLPIDPARTAALLGFADVTRHALDAVASRDVALRLLGAAAGLTVLLSRLAVDLQLWSTAEFGFVGFPDRLVGGSSAMPQKRNAFLLEHLRAKAGQAIGAWTAAASTMSTTPFTNSIEVGTEAVASVRAGLGAAEQAVLLAQVLVAGARPDAARMAERAATGFTTATSVANRLVRNGMAFRSAHHLVGDAVRRAVEAGSTDFVAFGPPGWLDEVGHGELDLAGLTHAQTYGGGPGDFTEPFARAVRTWAGHRHWLRCRVAAERAATRSLAAAVESQLAGTR